MGVFDNVQCDYPLPWEEAKEFGTEWQTKSPDAPNLQLWEIRSDGSLWHQDVDYEDRSDPNAEGLNRFCGIMTATNHRWRFVPWNGEFEIHHLTEDAWYTVTFWFRDGIVRDVIPKREARHKQAEKKLAGERDQDT